MKRVFAFIGFSCAITLFVLNVISVSLLAYLTVAIAALLLFSLLYKHTREAKVFPVIFAAALFSCVVFFVTYNSSVLPQKALEGKSAYCEFKMTESVKTTNGGTYEYEVKTSRIDIENAPQNIKIKLYSLNPIEDAQPYDYLSGNISFFSVGDKAFNSYGAYGEGFYVRGYINGAELIGKNTSKPLNYYIIKLRQLIKDELAETFDERLAGVACAILIGDKSLIDNETQQSLAIAGMSHITAVSGIHVGIIYLAVKSLLFFIRRHYKLQGIIIISVVSFYIVIAGASKSSIRAGIMLFVLVLSKIINRQADTLNSLGFACFIMCINPFAVTDASAVLTVSAMLGITVIYPLIYNEIKKDGRIISYVMKSVSASVSVIIATLPAVWLFFKRMSLSSILSNFAVILLVQAALIFLLLFLIFLPFKYIGLPFAFASKIIIRLIIGVADLLSSHLSFLFLDINYNFVGVAIGAAFVFAGIAIVIFKNPSVKAVFVISLAMIFAVLAFESINSKNEVRLIVSPDGGIFIDDSNYLLTYDSKSERDLIYIRKNGNDKEIIYADFKGKYTYSNTEMTVSEESADLNIYNNHFEISDDYVTINNNKYVRDISGSFSLDFYTVFYINDGKEIYVGRVYNG